MMRFAEFSRKTAETDISVALNLDGVGKAEIKTGLGFLDHLLHNFTLHGLFDLHLHAQGDLQVDPHHTVEDVALVLGSAFDRALGERRGIVRMGDCFCPMDESLAHVVSISPAARMRWYKWSGKHPPLVKSRPVC